MEETMESVWWTIIRAIIRIIWITSNQVVVVPTYFLLLLIFYPLYWIWPSGYWEMESWLFGELIRMVGYWLWSSGCPTVEYGELPFRYANDRCIVVVNHQSSADVPTICAAMGKKGVGGGKILWVLDVMFKWTNFGVINIMHGDFFVQQGRDVREQQCVRLAAHLQASYLSRDRRWIIVFPEGGFLCNRRETSQAYARAHGFPVLQHVTLPRIGAVKTMLETLNPVQQQPAGNVDPNANNPAMQEPGRLPCCRRQVHPEGFRYLVDITMGYPNGVPLTLWAYLFGHRPGNEVGIHYRLFRIEDVPHNSAEEVRDFLYQLWEEKERKLEHYNRFGHFPGIPRDEGFVVDYHWAGMISRHCLFMVIAYFMYTSILPMLWNILMRSTRCIFHVK